MNTTRLFAIATLFFLGGNAAVAATGPAWTEEGFIMEEVVVTAEAPAHLYMEEIVVTAKAPAHLYMEEIVVTAQAPEHLYMEEVVITASREDLRDRMLARLRLLRPALLDRG